MQTCPFCGAPETDRIEIDGHRFLVFGCMFTPAIDAAGTEEEITEEIGKYARPGTSKVYFRGMCDRLHLFVAKGEGARVLKQGHADPPDVPSG